MRSERKIKLVALALTLILLLGTAGCGGGGEASSDNGLEEFDIVLDWYPNAVHTFLYAAIEKGYFEEEGLKLNIQFPANPNDGISMPAAGKADLGIYYQMDTLMTKYNEGVPVVSIGALLQKSMNVVISLKEANINSPKDLIGKKVGYAGAAQSEAEMASIMEHVGASMDDIEFIDVGFDLLTATTTGQVDATIGNMVNHEVPQLEENGFEINYFFPTDYGVPQNYELIFIAGEKSVNENPEKFRKFLRAAQKGYEFTKNNPEEALQILLNNQNEENFPLSENVEKKSLDFLLPAYETEEAEFLSQDVKVWQESADWLYERGILDEKADVSGIVVDLLQ